MSDIRKAVQEKYGAIATAVLRQKDALVVLAVPAR